MKTVLFVVYHDLDYNARSQEMLEMARYLGDKVVLLSQSKPAVAGEDVECYACPKTAVSYAKFLSMALSLLKKKKPDIVLLHDNYTAPILRHIIRKKIKVPIIYDSSELYIDRKVNGALQRIVLGFLEGSEVKYLKYALISIAANEERAKVMTDRMDLKRPTIVFDNMHRIDDEPDDVACDAKYSNILCENCINILYAGGLSTVRRSFELVEAVAKLGDKYNLIITGKNMTPNGTEKIGEILKKYSQSNVHYVNQVPRSELKYLLSKVDFSVSVFAEDTLNNIYCASGKLYESIFEGVPVLTSENPPLARLCREKNVGVSDNDFYRGIIKLSDNIYSYKQSVDDYRTSIDYERRVTDLAKRVAIYVADYNDNKIKIYD